MERLGVGSLVTHPSFGPGVVVEADKEVYKIYFNESEEVKNIGIEYDGLEIRERQEAAQPSIDLDDFEKRMNKVIQRYIDPVERVALGNKWIGGTIEIKPGDDDLQPKELPIETLFRKVVLVRDKLRVLEQNINSHEKLDDEDRIHLQQYITKAYGSLTTFNSLFNHKDYYFKGQSAK